MRLVVGNAGPNLIETKMDLPGRFLLGDHGISRAMDAAPSSLVRSTRDSDPRPELRRTATGI